LFEATSAAFPYAVAGGGQGEAYVE